jgi:hypothetical protein
MYHECKKSPTSADCTLAPGTSCPPSDVASKYDTGQRYIFEILNMLMTFKKINFMREYLEQYPYNKTICSCLQSRETIPLTMRVKGLQIR